VLERHAARVENGPGGVVAVHELTLAIDESGAQAPAAAAGGGAPRGLAGEATLEQRPPNARGGGGVGGEEAEFVAASFFAVTEQSAYVDSSKGEPGRHAADAKWHN